MAGIVGLDRGDSNHSDAKYETSLDGHEMLRSQNHDLTTMVRTGHEHDQVEEILGPPAEN